MIKFFEIRDRATFIPVYAFRARPITPGNEAERYLLARTGYGPLGDSECVIMGRLEGGYYSHCDAFGWNSRTLTTAHLHLENHFDELPTGSVLDVEYILGETKTAKISERIAYPGHEI